MKQKKNRGDERLEKKEKIEDPRDQSRNAFDVIKRENNNIKIRR